MRVAFDQTEKRSVLWLSRDPCEEGSEYVGNTWVGRSRWSKWVLRSQADQWPHWIHNQCPSEDAASSAAPAPQPPSESIADVLDHERVNEDTLPKFCRLVLQAREIPPDLLKDRELARLCLAYLHLGRKSSRPPCDAAPSPALDSATTKRDQC